MSYLAMSSTEEINPAEELKCVGYLNLTTLNLLSSWYGCARFFATRSNLARWASVMSGVSSGDSCEWTSFQTPCCLFHMYEPRHGGSGAGLPPGGVTVALITNVVTAESP